MNTSASRRTLTDLVKDVAIGTGMLSAATGGAYLTYQWNGLCDFFVKNCGPQPAAFFWGAPGLALTLGTAALAIEGVKYLAGYTPHGTQ